MFTFNSRLWSDCNGCPVSLSLIPLYDISYFNVAKHVELNMIRGTECHGVGVEFTCAFSNCSVRPQSVLKYIGQLCSTFLVLIESCVTFVAVEAQAFLLM
jgi:hypothetical protein